MLGIGGGIKLLGIGGGANVDGIGGGINVLPIGGGPILQQRIYYPLFKHLYYIYYFI